MCLRPRVLVQNHRLHDVASKWFVDVKDEVLVDACGVNDKSMECIPAVRAHDVLRLWEHKWSSETARWKILLGRTGARVE